MPPSPEDLTRIEFPALGVRNAADVRSLFEKQRDRFTNEFRRAAEQGNWENLRRAWQGPEGTERELISTNWVQRAPEALRAVASREYELFVGFIYTRLQVIQSLQELGVTNPEAIAS